MLLYNPYCDVWYCQNCGRNFADFPGDSVCPACGDILFDQNFSIYERICVVPSEEVDHRVDDALNVLNTVNSGGSMDYADYSALFDAISAIACGLIVEKKDVKMRSVIDAGATGAAAQAAKRSQEEIISAYRVGDRLQCIDRVPVGGILRSFVRNVIVESVRSKGVYDVRDLDSGERLCIEETYLREVEL